MLVNCVAYQKGEKVADIRREEIGEYLKRPEAFVWVAMFEPDAAEMSEMQHQFGLHELAVEDASKGHQRPKIEEYGNSLFVVLHTVDLVEGTALDVGEVDIFVGPNYILSVRRHTKRGFSDVRARCETEPNLLQHGSGFVLYALMDSVVDRYFPVLDALSDEQERLEEAIFRGTLARSKVEALYDLKRKLMTVKHVVAPLLEAVGKLYGGRVPQVCMRSQEYFRDVYDHLGRIDQLIDGLRDMVTAAMNVTVSLIQLQENDVTKRLAAYAALVAVPTLIAGIYGMNFTQIPELEWAYGYPMALAVMAGIDFWLFRRFRKAGWL